VVPDSFHARFAEVWPSMVGDEEFERWFDPGMGRPTARSMPRLGAIVCAAVEGSIDAAALRRLTRDRLGAAARPRRLLIVERLPRTVSGLVTPLRRVRLLPTTGCARGLRRSGDPAPGAD
jgi:acyl-CoA synthetase (AMP-forming)/AMP-acid ligase II